MKIIFLDFDGVLNNLTRTRYRLLRTEPDAQNLAALRRILCETGASIVVSSSWRKWGDDGFVYQTLRDWGVMAPILGITSRTGVCDRIQRIYAWLDQFQPEGEKVDSYVILDDMGMNGCGCHVKTDPVVGLTEQDADRAIQILNDSRIVSDGEQQRGNQTQTKPQAA